MIPQRRKLTIISLVIGLCAWFVIENLAIGSNFGRFVLSQEWQRSSMTIIRLNALYDYVEKQEYEDRLRQPFSEIVERHGGSVPPVSAVKFEELCNSRANWQQVFVFEVPEGRVFSQIATSMNYRNLESTNASILRSSAEFAIRSDWNLGVKRSHLMILAETRLDDQMDRIINVIARTVENHQGMEVVLAERAFSLTGKRNFNTGLVIVIALNEFDDLDNWIESIVTKSELAILNQDLDQVHAFRLTTLESV